ncbi:pentatricopeptide repeat-containing protein At2g15980 [Malania oleifera]|uniref:pentatricopeptide repeat-containing protein At2g15980 n=1 Tax=Malania oleifera TaxID=397392 RepID=UPI0025AE0A19|nr:pentatricopeptide repeat-containing protein At2g15980 [Malania oleifera]
MAISTKLKPSFSPNPSLKLPSLLSSSFPFSSLPQPHLPASPSDKTLISTAVSVLTNHRSKSRWSRLRSLCPAGFRPSEVSQITLLLRNNAHLALRFFLWTRSNSLCNHTLLSYSTIVHVLARARLKSHAQLLLQSALRVSDSDVSDVGSSSKPPKIFETLVKTYRSCDSAPFVFDLLTRACLQSNRIDQAIAIVRILRSRAIYPKVSTCNSLIRSVSRRRGSNFGYDMYREVFGLDDGEIEIKSKSFKVYPNAQTFNELMLCFYQDGAIEKVEEVWAEMAKLNCAPNAYSYSILMATYCEEGEMGEAERLWEEMQIKGIKHDVVAYNTMIGGFCKTGEIGRAEEFFREMTLSGIEGTCVTFENLINGYCKIKDVDSAMLLYRDMQRKGFKAEALTVDAVIGGLCDKRRVSEALEFSRGAMGNPDYFPSQKSYEFLMKGFCEEGKMGEALKVQEEMVGKGFPPNSEIYSAFIDGYMKERNMEMAEMLRKEMFETQMQKENN